jgi:signal transduction histidine kinase
MPHSPARASGWSSRSSPRTWSSARWARSLEFAIHDVGAGFEPRTTPKGMGLQIMLDRVEAFGGTLSVESAPGEGTTVTGRVPVRAEAVAR